MQRQDADPNLILTQENNFEEHLDTLALDAALSKLSDQQPRIAKLVELRYFAVWSLKDAGVCLAFPRERPIATGRTPRHGCTANWARGEVINLSFDSDRREFLVLIDFAGVSLT